MTKTIWEQIKEEIPRKGIYDLPSIAAAMPSVVQDEIMLFQVSQIREFEPHFVGDENKLYPRVVFRNINHLENLHKAFKEAKLTKVGALRRYVTQMAQQHKHIIDTYYEQLDNHPTIILRSKHHALNDVKKMQYV